jgi:hypothetical protein
MDWKQFLASITGSVDQELLVRNAYLVRENRSLRQQITGRVRLSDGEWKTLAELRKKLGKKTLEEVTMIVTSDTILAWYRVFFIQLASRKVYMAGVTPYPDQHGMMQMARNVAMADWGVLAPGQYLIHDRDGKFCPAFQRAMDEAGVIRVVLPPRSPNGVSRAVDALLGSFPAPYADAACGACSSRETSSGGEGNVRVNPNGIQLVSKCMLYQGLTQHTSWFTHTGEGFGPPLFDSGLNAVRTRGIDEQDLQRHAGVRGAEPAQSVQKADPFHVDLVLDGRLQDDQAHQIIEDSKDEEFRVDPQHGFTMQHIHLHRGLELCQMSFGVPVLPIELSQVSTWVALRIE